MIASITKMIIGIVILLLAPFVLMLLWNWLMPMIFGLVTITYFQSIGLYLLSGILFKPVVSMKEITK